MTEKFIGIWGDIYSEDGLNIKVQKKDGKVFYIHPNDIAKFLEIKEWVTKRDALNRAINCSTASGL